MMAGTPAATAAARPTGPPPTSPRPTGAPDPGAQLRPGGDNGQPRQLGAGDLPVGYVIRCLGLGRRLIGGLGLGQYLIGEGDELVRAGGHGLREQVIAEQVALGGDQDDQQADVAGATQHGRDTAGDHLSRVIERGIGDQPGERDAG